MPWFDEYSFLYFENSTQKQRNLFGGNVKGQNLKKCLRNAKQFKNFIILSNTDYWKYVKYSQLNQLAQLSYEKKKQHQRKQNLKLERQKDLFNYNKPREERKGKKKLAVNIPWNNDNFSNGKDKKKTPQRGHFKSA